MTLPLRAIANAIRFQQHHSLTACWVWTGPVSSSGVATTSVGGEVQTARQAVYRSYRGEPQGRLVAKCRVKLCVNPSHTEVKPNHER